MEAVLFLFHYPSLVKLKLKTTYIDANRKNSHANILECPVACDESI